MEAHVGVYNLLILQTSVGCVNVKHTSHRVSEVVRVSRQSAISQRPHVHPLISSDWDCLRSFRFPVDYVWEKGFLPSEHPLALMMKGIALRTTKEGPTFGSNRVLELLMLKTEK